MTTAAVAQQYLDLIAARSPVVKALLARAGATGALLAEFVDARVYPSGTTLIEQGSRPRELFLLVSGEAEAIDKARGLGGSPLSAPDVLGEISMVTKLPAIANVVAVSQVRALALSHTGLADLMGRSPGTALALLRAFAENVVDKIVRGGAPSGPIVGTPVAAAPEGGPVPSLQTMSVTDRLAEMRAFQWTSEEVDSGVANLFRTRLVHAGDRFITDGEKSDSLYLLAAGTARVDTLDGPVSAFVGGHSLCEHVLIGELSFLTSRPRSGTVIAVTDCELLELSSTQMGEMVRMSPGFTGRLLLGVLRAVCRKLVESSAMRARYEAVIGGDWKEWFVDDDDFSRRFGG